MNNRINQLVFEFNEDIGDTWTNIKQGIVCGIGY